MSEAKSGMSTGMKVVISLAALLVVVVLAVSSIYGFVVGSVYNPYKLKQQDADAQWAEVVNQYQRRSDLIPNLVAIVSQAAGHENSTLKAVIEF